ncbi:Hsp70 family protein [Metabacillus litoralis]|uniref:Hsp70 family protein n=1 Tax=Metabacillus litoralis TaxID=152268 RepID=UPI002040CBB2|nr:Hsp70 family protein [Metabacillus litoralis]MCM3162622.1 Hsp70 family protein [Metabacillus litoralis]
MGTAIGIDLGTSNSAVAVYSRGKVETIPVDGRKTMPSVISYKDNGQILVGNAAKARLYIDPQNSIASSKRFIGNKDKVYSVHNRTVTPVDVAKNILEKIRVEASKYIGKEVKDAVITIPAYFTDEQREATRKAGEMAGLNVLRLLSEPTAAAIAYGLDKERNQTIMVYDLGGGTFDVSILKVENNNFRVVAVDGDSMLGGDDFDEVITEYLMKKLNVSGNVKHTSNGSTAVQQLKEAVEELKKELSESDFADITIPDIFGTHLDEEVDIHTFNRLTQSLLNRTIDKIQEVLKAAGLTKNDISRVILVGGSTRMRAVQEVVAKQIKQPYIADNIDEIVAQGAAIMAANLSAPDLDSTPVPIEVEEVTSHSIGIGLVEVETDEFKVFHLINKNTKLPCTGAKFCYTIHPYQKEMYLQVFRTESRIPTDESKIGDLTLKVQRPQASTVSAVALFEIDQSGILTFSSAEVGRDSYLVRAYEDSNIVDIPLIESMLRSGELRTEKVIIDTNK